MIIWMKPEANILHLDFIVKFFESRGFAVVVKDNDGEPSYVFAIFGDGADKMNVAEMDRLPSVDKYVRNNDHFDGTCERFVNARAYFARKEEPAETSAR